MYSQDISKIAFFFRLPYPVQLRDGTVLVTFTDDSLPAALSTRIGLLPGRPLIVEGADHRVGRMFVSYRFSQSDVPLNAELDESMQHAITALLDADWTDASNLDQGDTTARQTIVEAITLIIGDSDEGAVRGALWRAVENLDRLFRSYQINLGSTIAPVKQEQLPPLIPYIVGPLDNSGTWLPELRRIATEPRFRRPPLGEDADLPTLEQLQVGLTRLLRGDPILQVWDRFHHARRLLFEGYAGDAVIHAQTGIELLSDTVGMLVLWERKMTPEAAAARFDWNFPKRLRRELQQSLGGTWDVDTEGPVRDWHAKLYKLRNQIVHRSLEPSDQQVGDALDTVGPYVEYVFDRLASKSHLYPRATLLVIGKPGVIERGVYSKRLREFVDLEADAESNWVGDFVAWRRRYLDLID